MATEIERKFLITDLDAAISSFEKVELIEQRYLTDKSAGTTVRVRLVNNEEAFLTIKGKGFISRPEFEYRIPVEDAKEMFGFTKNMILKVRYYVQYIDHLWEIDVFQGMHMGLAIAEIELNSEIEHFNLPYWIGEEVTNDARFSNSSLSHSMRVPDFTHISK
jgi:CYTH domain-containing protein